MKNIYGAIHVKADTYEDAMKQIKDEINKFVPADCGPPQITETTAIASTMDVSSKSGPSVVVTYWDVSVEFMFLVTE